MISTKPEQVLIIEPSNELNFVGPFNQAVSSVMSLSNPTNRRICFKIKTTAPKKYCVKPNSGILESKCRILISVSLQPFEFDPTEKNKHKFMVQSMYAPEGELNIDTLWKEVDPNNLMDSKLKCLFTLPQAGDSSSTTTTEPMSDNAAPVSFFKNSESDLNKSVDEMKKLQEEVSTLRQENIRLKEETFRLKRLASVSESGPDQSSYSVRVEPSSQNDLVTTYIYLALIMMLLGFIIGKWII